MRNLEGAVYAALAELNRFRMTGVDNFGRGRLPFTADPAAVIILTDGVGYSALGSDTDQSFVLPTDMTASAPFTKEPYRWDQQVYAINMHFAGLSQPGVPQKRTTYNSRGMLPQFCESTGGECHTVFGMKTLMQHMEHLVSRFIRTGVMVRLHAPGQRLVRILMYVPANMTAASANWPIPEAFLARAGMEKRTSHPLIDIGDPVDKYNFERLIPIDTYQLEMVPSYTVFVALRAQSKYKRKVWPVYIHDSMSDGTRGSEFGFISISKNAKGEYTVSLSIGPYAFPKLLSLLLKVKNVQNAMLASSMRRRLQDYCAIVPPYYLRRIREICATFGSGMLVPDFGRCLPKDTMQTLERLKAAAYEALNATNEENKSKQQQDATASAGSRFVGDASASKGTNNHISSSSALSESSDQFLQPEHIDRANLFVALHALRDRVLHDLSPVPSTSDVVMQPSSSSVATDHKRPDSPFVFARSPSSPYLSPRKPRPDTPLPFVLDGNGYDSDDNDRSSSPFPQSVLNSPRPAILTSGVFPTVSRSRRTSQSGESIIVLASAVSSSLLPSSSSLSLSSSSSSSFSSTCSNSLSTPGQERSVRDSHHRVLTHGQPVLRPLSSQCSIDNNPRFSTPISQMGNYVEVLKRQHVLRDPMSEDENSTRRVNFGSPYRKQKAGAQLEAVDEADMEAQQQNSSQSRKRKASQRPNFPLSAEQLKDALRPAAAKHKSPDKTARLSSNSQTATAAHDTDDADHARADRKSNRSNPNQHEAVASSTRRRLKRMKMDQLGSGITFHHQQLKTLDHAEVEKLHRAFWDDNQLHKLKRRFVRQLRSSRPNLRSLQHALSGIKGDFVFFSQFLLDLGDEAQCYNQTRTLKFLQQYHSQILHKGSATKSKVIT
jgi:hypothetical protein